jgi:hypothetical protein
MIYALLFGVGVDLDHYLRPSRFKDKNFWRSDGAHCDHTWLHEPFGLLLVALFSWWIKNPIPLLFYGIHFFIDQFILRALCKPFAPFSEKTYRYGLIPSGSKAEWILAPFLLAGSLAYLAWGP